MEDVRCGKIVAENLSSMHDARQAFIKSESNEKLRLALWHQVRISSEVKYLTGDKKYYKRRADDYWTSPTAVIGQENQQVLIKHGCTYQIIFPCKLRLIDCLDLCEMAQNSVSSRSYFTRYVMICET